MAISLKSKRKQRMRKTHIAHQQSGGDKSSRKKPGGKQETDGNQKNGMTRPPGNGKMRGYGVNYDSDSAKREC